jgi:hypothetical protein
MRPTRLDGWSNMAARLAGWRRVTRQVWFCTGRTACLFLTVPVSLTGAARLRADGVSSCCYIVNVHNYTSWAASRKEGMAWYSSRPMPSLWLSPTPFSQESHSGIKYAVQWVENDLCTYSICRAFVLHITGNNGHFLLFRMGFWFHCDFVSKHRKQWNRNIKC